MKNLLVSIYLLWGMIQDLKEKKISLVYIKIGAGLGVLFLLWEMGSQKVKIADILFSFLPGVLFLIISKITKEKIGAGDGLLFLVLGCCLGSKVTWTLWQLALLLSSVFSFVMLIMKKYRAESQVAFVPFVWIAHIFLWSMKYVT